MHLADLPDEIIWCIAMEWAAWESDQWMDSLSQFEWEMLGGENPIGIEEYAESMYEFLRDL